MRAPHSYILTCKRGASRLGNLLMDLSNRDIKSTVYHNDSVDFAKRETQGYPFTFNYDGIYDLHFPISLTDGEFACTQTCNETFGNGKNTFTFYDIPLDMSH